MVVGFNFGDHCFAVSDVDDASIFLSRFNQEPIAFVGEQSQEQLGVFVPAMFAPHGAEEP